MRPARLHLEQAITAACGDCHTAAVTEDGHLWTWGRSHANLVSPCSVAAGSQRLSMPIGGKLHAYSNILFAPTPSARSLISDPHHRIPRAKSCPKVNLTGSHPGRGCCGALGLGDEDDQLEPQLVGLLGGYGQVGMISLGQAHTLAVTRSGELWACGAGDQGQLGLNAAENKLRPCLIESRKFAGGRVVHISAGSQHSIAITDSGDVWTWG